MTRALELIQQRVLGGTPAAPEQSVVQQQSQEIQHLRQQLERAQRE